MRLREGDWEKETGGSRRSFRFGKVYRTYKKSQSNQWRLLKNLWEKLNFWSKSSTCFLEFCTKTFEKMHFPYSRGGNIFERNVKLDFWKKSFLHTPARASFENDVKSGFWRILNQTFWENTIFIFQGGEGLLFYPKNRKSILGGQILIKWL